MKKFFKKLVEGTLTIIGQLGVAFIGQLGAMAAIDYYHKLKEEMETKKPIGFQIKK